MSAKRSTVHARCCAGIIVAAFIVACPVTFAVAESAKSVKDFVMKHNLDKQGNPVEGQVAKESTGWKATDFSGKGKVRVEGDTVFLEMGNDMTGITW